MLKTNSRAAMALSGRGRTRRTRAFSPFASRCPSTWRVKDATRPSQRARTSLQPCAATSSDVLFVSSRPVLLYRLLVDGLMPLSLCGAPTGVRFNAEKKAIGKYHSTPIYSFRMISPCCNQTIEVHTDPKAAEYILVEVSQLTFLLNFSV